MSYAIYFSFASLILIAPHAPRRLALACGWFAMFLSLGCNLGWWLK